MPATWVVLLEATGDARDGPINARDVHSLHGALNAGLYGGCLHSADRYALQVRTTGTPPVEALFDVLARWADAVGQLGLPAWKLVRVEVFTPEELEREFEKADDGDAGVHPPEPEANPEEHDDAGHELLRRAFSDPLTGLLGRLAFVHRLESALVAAGDQRAVAVVCLDLDDFHRINDSFGGTMADQVLIAVAERLTAVLRPGDVVARLGDDQYGVLLEDSSAESAVAVAERMIDSVRIPVTLLGQDLTLTATAGVAVSQPGDSAQSVVDNAEAALNGANRAGGGAVLYGADVSHRAPTGRHFATSVLQDRLAHLQVMQQSAVAANQAHTLHQAAEVVMRQICTHFGCALGLLWVSPGATGEGPEPPMWHIADRGHQGRSQNATEEFVVVAAGVAGRVMTTGRPVWTADLLDDDDVGAQEQAAAAGLRSGFAFPVVVGWDVVAVLAFFSRTHMDPTDSFGDVVAGIGAQLGRVVERQRAAEAVRRSTQRLRESEARLREAQRLAGMGSWHVDLRSGEASWSDAMYDLYQVERGQPPDLGSVLATVHPDDRVRVDAALSRLIETGEPTTEEFRTRRADGQVRWHRSCSSAVRDDDGLVVAIHGTTQDITEAKLAEQTLRERERQLGEVQRAARLGWREPPLPSGRLTLSEEMCR